MRDMRVRIMIIAVQYNVNIKMPLTGLSRSHLLLVALQHGAGVLPPGRQERRRAERVPLRRVRRRVHPVLRSSGANGHRTNPDAGHDTQPKPCPNQSGRREQSFGLSRNYTLTKLELTLSKHVISMTLRET